MQRLTSIENIVLTVTSVKIGDSFQQDWDYCDVGLTLFGEPDAPGGPSPILANANLSVTEEIARALPRGKRFKLVPVE